MEKVNYINKMLDDAKSQIKFNDGMREKWISELKTLMGDASAEEKKKYEHMYNKITGDTYSISEDELNQMAKEAQDIIINRNK